MYEYRLRGVIAGRSGTSYVDWFTHQPNGYANAVGGRITGRGRGTGSFHIMRLWWSMSAAE
jgi:hypothetical protein